MVQKPVGLQRHERRHPDAAAGLPEKLHERAVIFRERLRCDFGKVRLFGMVGYGLPIKVAVIAAEGQNNLRALARVQPLFRNCEHGVAASAHLRKIGNHDPLLRKRVKIVFAAKMVPPVLIRYALGNRVAENHEPFSFHHR